MDHGKTIRVFTEPEPMVMPKILPPVKTPEKVEEEQKERELVPVKRS